MKLKICKFFIGAILAGVFMTSASAYNFNEGFDKGKDPASSISVDCSNFSKNLSCFDVNVQHALNTLDQLSSGAVSSVSNSDGSLVISPTTGIIIASIDTTHINQWTGKQEFFDPLNPTGYGGQIFMENGSGRGSSGSGLYIDSTVSDNFPLRLITPSIYIHANEGSTPSITLDAVSGNGFFNGSLTWGTSQNNVLQNDGSISLFGGSTLLSADNTVTFGSAGVHSDTSGTFFASGFQTVGGGYAFTSDGSGYLGNAGVQWDSGGNITSSGTASFSSGACVIDSNGAGKFYTSILIGGTPGTGFPTGIQGMINTDGSFVLGNGGISYSNTTGLNIASHVTVDNNGLITNDTWTASKILGTNASKQMVSLTVAKVLGAIDLAARSTAVSAATVFIPSSTGMYRISIYLQVTRAASTSSILGGGTGVTIAYTDGDGSVAQSNVVAMDSPTGTVVTTSATNTTATNLIGVINVYAKTGVAVQYSIGYTSVGVTTMQYTAHLVAEQLF